MMGKFVDALSGDTTHLLVQKAGSEKHQAALQYGVKLLRFAWLADSWVRFLTICSISRKRSDPIRCLEKAQNITDGGLFSQTIRRICYGNFWTANGTTRRNAKPCRKTRR